MKGHNHVICESCEARSASQRFTRDVCPFISKCKHRSSSGVVVKLLACEARGPEFDSRSRRYDITDWLSPASKSPYGVNPQNNQPTNPMQTKKV